MTRFIFRKLEDLGVAPLGNLIKADVHHVVAEGNQLLAEVAEQRRRAYDAALEQGRKDGVAEGRKANAALMAEAAAAAREFWRNSERRLADIVTEAVRRILGEFEGAELAAGMVRQLLKEVTEEGRIRVRVAPAEVGTVRDRVRAMQRCSGAQDIEIIEDASIGAGACRMETELGIVETSVDAQLEALGAAVGKVLEEQRRRCPDCRF